VRLKSFEQELDGPEPALFQFGKASARARHFQSSDLARGAPRKRVVLVVAMIKLLLFIPIV